MDQEPVRKAIQVLFRERHIAMTEAPISPSYVWGFSVKFDDEVAFSIDLQEEYVLRMVREFGMLEFQRLLIEHVCSEIQCSFDEGRTYTEKNRTLH